MNLVEEIPVGFHRLAQLAAESGLCLLCEADQIWPFEGSENSFPVKVIWPVSEKHDLLTRSHCPG